MADSKTNIAVLQHNQWQVARILLQGARARYWEFESDVIPTFCLTILAIPVYRRHRYFLQAKLNKNYFLHRLLKKLLK